MSSHSSVIDRLFESILEGGKAIEAVDFPTSYPPRGDAIEEKARGSTYLIFYVQASLILQAIRDIHSYSELMLATLSFRELVDLNKLQFDAKIALSKWNILDTGVWTRDTLGVTELKIYQDREALLQDLRRVRDTLVSKHISIHFPIDSDELVSSIGALAARHFETRDYSEELVKSMNSAKELIIELDRKASFSRDILETKEIKRIGAEYKESAEKKNTSFKWSFGSGLTALVLIPLAIHITALQLGLKSGLFSAELPALLPVTAALTFAISGMLFKLAWTYFQQKALMESREKLCMVLNDFLDNFKEDVDRGEIVRMIAFSLFMDNSQSNNSISDMSAMTAALGALTSTIKSESKP